MSHHNQHQQSSASSYHGGGYHQQQINGGYGGGMAPPAGKPSSYGAQQYGGHMQKGMPLQSVSEEPAAAVLARAGLTPAGGGNVGAYGGAAGGNKRVGQPPSMMGHPGFGHLAQNRRPPPMARNHYW